MQTFLPLSDIESSLRCLDYRRAGKQRVEAMQIHNILTGKTDSKAWRNHPAVKMWKGYEKALAYYHNKAIEIWIERGYNNNMKLIPIKGEIIFPPWFENKGFFASHRSNLLRKKPEYYRQFGWKESPDLPYVWPIE